MGGSELSSKTISKTLRAVSARESAHADHASQETLRPPILPTLDPLSLPLPSQHHSTVRSPAGCHINRYADRFLSRRSEEHTSELQSRQYLVCRLLLEKKKKESDTITDELNNNITTFKLYSESY